MRVQTCHLPILDRRRQPRQTSAANAASLARTLLVAAVGSAAWLAVAGCTALPGFEDERDALLFNESGGEVITYKADSPTGDRARDLTTEPGGTATLAVGGDCETGWWVERKGVDPVALDEVCPGDQVTVTGVAIQQ